MFRCTVRRVAGLAAASLTLTLAACGSDGGTTASTAAPTSAAATTSTAAPKPTEAPTSTAPKPTDAPTTAAPAPKPLRIGFLPPGLDIPAFQGLWHGLEGYGGGRYGDTVVAVDAKFDPTVQIQTIEQWTQLKQVDAMWVIPVAGEAIAPQLKAAAEAGIAIVAGGFPADFGFDGPVPGITFSAVDNVNFGKGIGDLMAQCVNKRLAGSSKVIYIGPNVASITTDNINNSSKAALAAGAPKAQIVQELVAATDLAGSQQIIESSLQGHPDSNGFMAGDAESTIAGLNAYTAAGNDPKKICLVGNGGTDDQIAAVKSGDLYGVVAFDFESDLTQNVDELHRLAADPTAEGQQLTVPIKIIGA